MKIIWKIQGCGKKKRNSRSKRLGRFIPNLVLGDRRSEEVKIGPLPAPCWPGEKKM